MSSVEWQSITTITERIKFMLNKDRLSDVKFVVRKSDVDSESKQVIPAHKFVLAIGSPVFEAMFYGDLAETRDSIELPDCEYESLLELFRFMYSDEVNLSESNVMGVLYLAKKYLVPALVDKCTKYLQDKLDPLNVFSILPSACGYGEKTLEDQCWEVIDDQTEAAIKSDGFAIIERSLLEAVVERDTLNIAEVELFKGVMEWAKKESNQRGVVADGQEKRRILGERIVKAIRFSLMKQEEFVSVILDSKILTYDEVTTILKCFNSLQTFPSGFPVTKRSSPRYNPKHCCRFSSMKFGWINSGVTSGFYFSVDSEIVFHGVYLFGSKDNTYSASLKLEKDLDGFVLASTSSTFLSLPHTSGEYYGFAVLFEKAVLLKRGGAYYLEASIAGPKSWYGTQGQQTLHCSGVTFNLRDTRMQYASFSDLTNTKQGQINELIFSLNR